MTADHALIVLAAGGSVRLGRPKQLLQRDGEPLVRRALRLGLATQPQRAIVVLGARRDSIAATLPSLRCEIALHAAWRDGLGASLRVGAAALADHRGRVLIIVCDQPALSVEHLQALLAGSASASSSCAAVLHDGRPGVPAVVPAAMLAAMLEDDAGGRDPIDSRAIRQGHARVADRGLAPRLRSLPPISMFALDAPELALDIDTPDDLRRAIALGLVDDDAGHCDTAGDG